MTVLPDGKVACPVVGEVEITGKNGCPTPERDRGEILSLYVKDAVITVEVRQVNSLQIYVLGRVKTPGRTVLTSNIDILQALGAAGGPDQFAKVSRIKIFRRDGRKSVMIPFDYDDVMAGKNLESNILLPAGGRSRSLTASGTGRARGEGRAAEAVRAGGGEPATPANRFRDLPSCPEDRPPTARTSPVASSIRFSGRKRTHEHPCYRSFFACSASRFKHRSRTSKAGAGEDPRYRESSSIDTPSRGEEAPAWNSGG